MRDEFGCEYAQDWKALTEFASECFLSPNIEHKTVGAEILKFLSPVDGIYSLMNYVEKYQLVHHTHLLSDFVQFLNQHDARQCMLTIIDYLRNLPFTESDHIAISKPSDIKGLMHKLHSKDWQPFHDFLVSVTESWLDGSTPENIGAVAIALAQKMFSSPDDTVAVKLCGKLSIYLSKAPQQVANLIYQELSRHDFIAWELWPKEDTIFCRLSPLLLMRVMPSSFYPEATTQNTDDSLWDNLARILIKMSFNNHEFDDVRRVAAELIARFPLCLHHKETREVFFQSWMENEYSKTKTYVFYICSTITWHSTRIKEHVTDYLNCIFKIISSPNVEKSQDLQKAQAGCVDVFALLLLHSPEDEISFPLQESEESLNFTLQEMAWNLLDLLHHQPSRIHGCPLFPLFHKEFDMDPDSDAFKTFLLNTFLRQLNFMTSPESFEAFGRSYLKIIFSGFLNIKNHTLVRKGCLQATYQFYCRYPHASFDLEGYLNQTVDLVLDSSAEVRIGSLKLILTAVWILKKERRTANLNPQKIVKSLNYILETYEDEEHKALAGQILKALLED